jgi:DNA-binding transcriptional MerR regulator
MEEKTSGKKLVYRLDEICRIAKVPAKTIESWEKEFYFLRAGRTASGKKIFREKDLEIVIRLKALLETEKLTLAGAKRRIEEEFCIKTPSPVHPERLKKTLSHIREQLKEISHYLDNK